MFGYVVDLGERFRSRIIVAELNYLKGASGLVGVFWRGRGWL